MSQKALISAEDRTDAGGVAGRRGPRFQDHVAAGFVLHMIADPALHQVECETGDDIVLRWHLDSTPTHEYVQIKTTENDAKWSIKELCARDRKREGTSIAERSLACDKHGGHALFRLVTQRDLRADLKLFAVRREKRSDVATAYAALVGKGEPTPTYTLVFARTPKCMGQEPSLF